MTDLPEKFSDGLELALADLLKCEADPHYKIDMQNWHVRAFFEDDGTMTAPCDVCMAGAVMAQTLGSNLNKSFIPGDFDNVTRYKLLAINEFRAGSIAYAAAYWYNQNKLSKVSEIEILHKICYEDQGIPQYEDNRPAFLEYWRGGIEELRKRGL